MTAHLSLVRACTMNAQGSAGATDWRADRAASATRGSAFGDVWLDPKPATPADIREARNKLTNEQILEEWRAVQIADRPSELANFPVPKSMDEW